MVNYHDREMVEFLEFGWPISHKGNLIDYSGLVINHKGATNYMQEIDSYLKKQLDRGTLLGPFEKNPFVTEVHYALLNTRGKRL